MTPITAAKTPSTLKWLKVRLCVTALVLSAGLAGIMWKAWQVQIRDGARMRAMAEAQYLHELKLPAPRGSIHDTNGMELAVSIETDSVWANPREIVDVAGTARKLGAALGLEVADLESKLGADRGFVWIKRRVQPEEARRVRALALTGVAFVSEPRRFYPGRDLAGPVLGFSGLDGHGLEGVELSLDQYLSGTRAALPAVRDGRGNLLLASDPDEALPPATAGARVTLTIDRFIQYTTEQALADALLQHKARSGVAIVMDPRTGDLLALASAPSFDPNDPSTKHDARNRAVTDTFEPGSVMKVFTIAAALDANAVKASDTVEIDGGRLQIGRKTIRDTHFEKALLTVGEVLQISSNVGAAKIARRLGKEKLAEGLLALGFGAPSGIELPGERVGRLGALKRWGEIGLATRSFGYGLTVTPLQIAAGVAAVANGGLLMTPRIVKRIVAADGRVVREVTAPAGRRVLREETAADVAAMMQLVMEPGGTGEKIKVPGFLLAGKTGTAHKVDPNTHKYSPDRYLSSFVGFAPADNPRLVIVIMIDEPRGRDHYGGAVAGPVFARIASECLKYLGVRGADVPGGSAPSAALAAPAVERAAASAAAGLDETLALDEEIDELEDLPPAGPGEDIVIIPDFAGMSIAQAMTAARAAGVKVEIEGSGRAVRQFPQPGRAMKSITCRITFDPR